MKKSDLCLLVLLALGCSILPARADAMGYGGVIVILVLPWLLVALAVIAIVLIIRHIRRNK